jgi:hypothetical protein
MYEKEKQFGVGIHLINITYPNLLIPLLCIPRYARLLYMLINDKPHY